MAGDQEYRPNTPERIWRVLSGLRFWNKLMQLLGWLGVRRVLKRTYCRLFGPNGGIVSLEVAGLTTKLLVHTRFTAHDLKQLQGEGPMLEAMIGALRPGDCAWDIGAEVGLFTFFLAKAVGELGLVIAFEPYSEAYERLQDNLTLNGACNVRLFRLALSDHSGEGMLYSGWHSYAPTLRNLQGAGKSFSWAERPHIVEGDRLLAEQCLPIPRAAKIDVEGAEDSVIQGLSRTLSDPACELLCCEIHPGVLPIGATPDTILSRIRSLGFNLIEVRPAPEHTSRFVPEVLMLSFDSQSFIAVVRVTSFSQLPRLTTLRCPSRIESTRTCYRGQPLTRSGHGGSSQSSSLLARK